MVSPLRLIFCSTAAGAVLFQPCHGWTVCVSRQRVIHRQSPAQQLLILSALSNNYLENDLVAITISNTEEDSDAPAPAKRLCAVNPDGGVYPLCIHEDDVETDLFIDPRVSSQAWTDAVVDGNVVGEYGEGWYGQRPVPSLGGGPGYGAEADPVWSIDEEVLETLKRDGVDLPALDVGIAHGEKARGGAF